MRITSRSVVLGLAAPVGALVFALLVCSVILAVTGHSLADAGQAIVDSANRPRTLVNSINSATNYYLAAVAVAIGFRMNLFNIGVDGQYRMAALIAAGFAGATFMDGLPPFVRVTATVVVAVAVGAVWAGIAAVLKVTRGVSEVISTIMLNAIAIYLGQYLLLKMSVPVAGSNNIGTRPISEGGQVPGFDYPGSTSKIYGLILLAVLVGILYWFMLSRTRFGFDLKATGLSESAAVVSGVSVRRMVLYAMLLSGGVAGLVGMPQLLGASHSFALDFPAGLGFIGIAVALLGRNHPVGMAIAALLWGILDNASNSLDVAGVPREIVVIMQGVVVLSVVIAYELVRRYRVMLEQRDVGRALGTAKVLQGVGS
jgi:general nucleoside transport system permease protein